MKLDPVSASEEIRGQKYPEYKSVMELIIAGT